MNIHCLLFENCRLFSEYQFFHGNGFFHGKHRQCSFNFLHDISSTFSSSEFTVAFVEITQTWTLAVHLKPSFFEVIMGRGFLPGSGEWLSQILMYAKTPKQSRENVTENPILIGAFNQQLKILERGCSLWSRGLAELSTDICKTPVIVSR